MSRQLHLAKRFLVSCQCRRRADTTLKSSGISVSGTRIRCLHTVLSETCVSGDIQAGAMARALRHCLDKRKSETNFIGQIHPSHRAWFSEYFDIKCELLQTPCTLSSGIFPHKPSLMAESIPPEDHPMWSNLEHMDSIDWQSKRWSEVGLSSFAQAV